MSVEDDTEKLCNRWITEYECWRMWTEFSQSGTVDDGAMNRTVYKCRGSPENFGDRKTHGYRLLMHFMGKIAEAAKEWSDEMSVENQNDVSLGQTVLEEAIDLLNYISNAFSRFEGSELREVQLLLRRYAVLAPLHKDNLTTAKAVFDRQWLHWKNSEEMKHRNDLATMINQETVNVNPDFSEVRIKCQKMLENIMTGMSKPYLLQAAEGIIQKFEAEHAELGPSTSSSALQQSPLKSTGENGMPSSDDTYVVAATEQLADADELSSDEGTGTMLSAVQSTAASTAAIQKSASNSSVSAQISSVDDIWRPSAVWRKKGKSVGKIAWSTVEEELVYKGVLAHGTGNWAVIHTDFLPNRSNVDIKDKWRTMKRQGRLQTLAVKFGPLPASCLY